MRHTWVVGLSLFLGGAACWAVEPIPQDTAAMEKRRTARLEWNRRTFEGAYDKVGKKNPKWDEPARKTLDLAARFMSRWADPGVTVRDVIAQAKVAVSAGCDDPLVVDLATGPWSTRLATDRRLIRQWKATKRPRGVPRSAREASQ